jgi:hypothetical protein
MDPLSRILRLCAWRIPCLLHVQQKHKTLGHNVEKLAVYY